jgi:hypothetical protein
MSQKWRAVVAAMATGHRFSLGLRSDRTVWVLSCFACLFSHQIRGLGCLLASNAWGWDIFEKV